jgi:hypothetical protein
MSQTLCKCLIWMSEAFWSGYQPQPWRCGIIFTPQVTLTSQIWGQLGQCNDVRVHPYSLETTYQWLKHYIYVIQMIWMWDTVNGGLQPQPWHHNIIQTQPYSIFPKIHPHLHMYYGIRVHPYAHPQHLKVLKHFLYIQYGCGIQSMGVGSLSHDTTTSYRLSHTPFFLKFTPTCTCITA